MSFDNQINKVNDTNAGDSGKSDNKKEFELIKGFLNSQPDRINSLNNISKTLNSIINNFIEYTKNYSNQIEFLAMKIIPDYSIEGELMQSIQALLLFYLEGLNNLVSELKDNMIVKQEENASEIIEQFKEQKKLYSQKIHNINASRKIFKSQINLYQEYLVNKEFKEHKKKGNSNNDDDDIIYLEEEKKEKEEKDNPKENSDLGEENLKDCPLNDIDNKSELIQSNKEYIKYINESNDILNKIRQFLSIEKTNLLKSIFNLCHYFVNGLLNFAKKSIKHFDDQAKVLNELLNKLILQEKSSIILTDFSLKLKYLEIYYSNVLKKTNLQINIIDDNHKNDNKNKKKIHDINNKKKEDKKNKKHKTITNKKKNTLLTTDNLNSKSINNLNERKTLNLSNKHLNYNYIGRTTFSPNQINEISEEEKEEVFKSMVKELNRDEIINIFEKIKETKITLNESDIKLIEQEKNFNKIKEILTILFKKPENYNEEKKSTLIKFFEKDKKYILYFIKVLNDHRAKRNYFMHESSLNYFGEIFKYLNNFVLSKNDMEIFKYILILSQTYYYNSEKDKKKLYLLSYIKDHPGYSKPELWEDYLKELIKHELKNFPEINIDLEQINLDKNNKDEKEKLMNCFFSNLLTTAKAMADLNLDKKFVRQFVEKNKTKYYLSQDQVDNICLIHEMSLNEDKSKNNQKETKNEKNDEENKIKQIKNDDRENKIDINQDEINNKENINSDKNEIKMEIDLEKIDEIKNIKEIDNIEDKQENNIIINEKKESNAKEGEDIKEEKDNIIEVMKEEKNIIKEEHKSNIEDKFNNIENQLDKDKTIHINEINIINEKQSEIYPEKFEEDIKNIEKDKNPEEKEIKEDDNINI